MAKANILTEKRLLIIALSLLLLALASCAKDPGPIAWETGAAEAIAKAEENKMPAFLFFSSPTCPFCKKMKEEIFPEKDFRIAMQGFVAVEIVANPENRSYFDMFSVKNIPAVIMLSPTGEELQRFVGWKTKESLIGAMEDTLDKSRS